MIDQGSYGQASQIIRWCLLHSPRSRISVRQFDLESGGPWQRDVPVHCRDGSLGLRTAKHEGGRCGYGDALLQAGIIKVGQPG